VDLPPNDRDLKRIRTKTVSVHRNPRWAGVQSRSLEFSSESARPMPNNRAASEARGYDGHMPQATVALVLEQVRAYLQEAFPKVTIAPEADAKTGSALIKVLSGRTSWAVEITDTFLDANASLPDPIVALRGWDLIGTLKRAESGSIVRVTTAGLRFV
jgi:hypothetical protein